MSLVEQGTVGTFAPLIRALPSLTEYRYSQTNVSADNLDDEIARVLTEWSALDIWESKTEINPVASSLPFPNSEVEAVAYVRQLLGISQNEVLIAARIRERTYFGWQESGHRPRRKSQGQLWPLVHVVSRLEAIHPNLRSWVGSSEEAKAAIRNGDLNALVGAQMDWAVRTLPARDEYLPSFWNDDAIEADVRAPEVRWDLDDFEDLEDSDIPK